MIKRALSIYFTTITKSKIRMLKQTFNVTNYIYNEVFIFLNFNTL